MTIEELRKYNDSYYCFGIAEALQDASNIQSEEVKEELINALYQLKEMAQNSYNSDCWRVLFNVLAEIAEMEE